MRGRRGGPGRGCPAVAWRQGFAALKAGSRLGVSRGGRRFDGRRRGLLFVGGLAGGFAVCWRRCGAVVRCRCVWRGCVFRRRAGCGFGSRCLCGGSRRGRRRGRGCCRGGGLQGRGGRRVAGGVLLRDPCAGQARAQSQAHDEHEGPGRTLGGPGGAPAAAAAPAPAFALWLVVHDHGCGRKRGEQPGAFAAVFGGFAVGSAAVGAEDGAHGKAVMAGGMAKGKRRRAVQRRA